MSSIMRSFVRAPRARLLPSVTAQPRRFAHSSYGDKQSGHAEDLESKNPKEHLEHPGPESPLSKDQGQTQNQAASSSSESSSSSSGGAQPKINTPKSAAEDTDPEVKKHNEEMANRHERSVNQLSEDDNKVDKQFWTGNVGDNSDKNSSAA